MPRAAYKFQTEVQPGGKVELTVPLPAGERIEVVIVTQENGFHELLEAANSSTEFWDNPIDDAEWNNA